MSNAKRKAPRSQPQWHTMELTSRTAYGRDIPGNGACMRLRQHICRDVSAFVDPHKFFCFWSVAPNLRMPLPTVQCLRNTKIASTAVWRQEAGTAQSILQLVMHAQTQALLLLSLWKQMYCQSHNILDLHAACIGHTLSTRSRMMVNRPDWPPRAQAAAAPGRTQAPSQHSAPASSAWNPALRPSAGCPHVSWASRLRRSAACAAGCRC